MNPTTAPEELGVIRLASPCNVKWSSMHGDDRVRFCDQCQLNVFNAEKLDAYQVRDMVMKAEGRVCMRFFRRFDGTMLTRDCPRGWALVQHTWEQEKKKAARRFAGQFGIAVAVLTMMTIGTITLCGDFIRRQFGMSAGDVGGGDPIGGVQRPRDPRETLIRAFRPQCKNPMAASELR